MTTDMPEEIWVGNRKGLYCTINEIPSAPDVAKYTRTDKHEELKAIAEKMAVALGYILMSHDATCKGEDCGIFGIDFARDAITEYNKFKGVG
jgi:hypothetical protein